MRKLTESQHEQQPIYWRNPLLTTQVFEQHLCRGTIDPCSSIMTVARWEERVMYILHTTLVVMYIVGVRFGQKPQRAFRPEALWGQASCVPIQKEPVTRAAELTPHRRRRLQWRMTESLDAGTYRVWLCAIGRGDRVWMPLDAGIAYGCHGTRGLRMAECHWTR